MEGHDKLLQNKGWDGYWLDQALQMIEFRLDKSGASVSSESDVVWKGIPRLFHFTKPFLIIVKVRGQERPYFVMWVDNAELLCKP